MSRELSGKLRILNGSTSGNLANGIAECLGIETCPASVGCFANGEVSIKVNESIRGDDVFIVQSTCSTESCGVNRSIMELLLLVNTLKLSSARRITAVIPHYGYARQDRKTESRVPISASAVAKMIREMGVDIVVTVDLHCGQIQGFFHGSPVADLMPSEEFADYGRTAHEKNLGNVVVVAPDAGAVTRARRLADKIGVERIVTILKRRVEAGKVEAMQLVGSVKGAVCIIVDDMIDTAGTLCKAATELKAHGAVEVHAYATHGILTDPACQRINDCDALVEVVVTDSLPQEQNLAKTPKLKVISLAPLLADAIRRIHQEESMEHVTHLTPAGAGSSTAAPIAVSGGAAMPDMELPTSLENDDEAWSLPK